MSPRTAIGATLALCCTAAFLHPGPGHAQTVNASQDMTCAGFRHGSTLGCTAGEFTVGATFTAAPGSPAFCTAGEVFVFDASLALSGSNADRYDMGFFVGQQNNSPAAATAGNICSVSTFPTGPAPFLDLDGDTCGDYEAAGVSNPIVSGLKVVCSAASGSNLSIPFVLTYNQNAGNACSVANVAPSSPSKCNAGSATLEISAVPVQVGGYVDVTKQTSPDGLAQSFSYTATGPAGSTVGVEKAGVFTANNTSTINFTLTDGETARVFMSVLPNSVRTLTITEQPAGQPTHWESQANISCSAALGSPVLATSNANRQVQAQLDTINKAAACTFTNTERTRVSLVEQVGGRLYAADQFRLTVGGAGSTQLSSNATGAAIGAGDVTVATSGAGTGSFSNATHPTFRATPGQALTFTTAMAPGSTAPLSSYRTRLTCTNAFAGAGATTALPVNQAVTTHSITPAPGDDITCTYTHTPRAMLTLAKSVVNDDGLTHVPTDWTLKATGPTTILGQSGSAAVTNAVLPAGTYTLSESGPVAYLMTSLSCTGGADADPSDGLVLASGEIVTCTFTNNDQLVGQALEKSDPVLTADPDGSGTVTVGDTLTYTVTLSNTGVNTLTNVQVGDPQLSPNVKTCPSVASGNTCLLVGTRLVTNADLSAGSIVNTASVTSNEIPGPTSSNTVTTPVRPLPPPALEVTKSHVGTFNAGSNASYTLQVDNTGHGAIGGTTTVTDTLDPNLQYVSATGTGWSCAVAGGPQVVTCTSTAGVASFGAMAPITLTVLVGGGVGSTVDNTAAVANTTISGNTPVTGNTDTAAVVKPDLSTSTKTVANLGGGVTADVDAGDVLRYTINLTETGGATASGVHVTDAIQSGLGNLVVTQLPPGATNNSGGSLLDISAITVPANSTVQVKFQVTVGSLAPGTLIDNTAVVDNPGGQDAAPIAPTLVYGQSLVSSGGEKILYVKPGGVLDRAPHAGIDTFGTTVAAGGTASWTTAALSRDLVLTAGTIDVHLSMQTNGQAAMQVQLWDGATQVGNSSAIENLDLPTAQVALFQVPLASDYALASGRALTLRVINSAGGNRSATVFAFNVGASKVDFETSTVVHVESVGAYADAWGSPNPEPAYFVLGDTAYIRVVASDPFGGSDVSASDSSLTITDANGAVVLGAAAIPMVDTSGATRTFEYALPIPAQAPLGMWTATFTAYEGTEHTIHHIAGDTFQVRGRVTVDQAWGAGATADDAVELHVDGGLDETVGGSTAPGPATVGTATFSGGDAVTLLQAFTSGSASGYSVTFECTQDADGSALAMTGSGLARQLSMPLDSSVTCLWTDTPTTPLTVVKLAMVQSDPINGISNPKAIPGAVVEYQFILTNPSSIAIDSGTVLVADPIPEQVALRVANIGGVGSGPVGFTDGVPTSGLTYTFAGLGSTTDDVEFSNDNGMSWTYVPSPDANGVDGAVTDIRINPKGAFAPNNAQFTLRFRVVVE